MQQADLITAIFRFLLTQRCNESVLSQWEILTPFRVRTFSINHTLVQNSWYVCRLGEPVSMSSRESRSRFLDVPRTHSVGCLGAWFASCATSTGSALSGVPGTHLGRSNSVEKLRGTDFCIGEISCYKPEHHGFWAPYGDRVIGSCYNLGNVFPMMIAAGWHLSEPPCRCAAGSS